MNALAPKSPVTPYSLKDAPSLIERLWPAQKISVEVQKERKAVQGQTITTLGTYWKGRKPLFLVRACVIASLLPATGDDEKDLATFEMLAGMSDDQIGDRFKTPLTIEEIAEYATPNQQAALVEHDDITGEARIKRLPKELRKNLMSGVLARMPYVSRVDKLFRPEEIAEDVLTASRLAVVNRHLGTSARSLQELIHQLGIMRFGHRPRVGDTFAGGGSIPFEAARTGCDVFASDLNPIACMLTWGAINIVGSSDVERVKIRKAQETVVRKVEKEISVIGIEQDALGNRSKAHLYCMEARCPQTGWLVPMLPTRVVSPTRKVIAVLVPDEKQKKFDIKIVQNATSAQLKAATQGTIRDGNLVYELHGELISTPIKTIRGDRRGPNGENVNSLRAWRKSDFSPHADDIFRERLYCVQWITKETLNKGRQETYFAGVTSDDIARESAVIEAVGKKISEWQAQGLVPDMAIESGDETARLRRERGWTYWHHLFNPRQLFIFATTHAAIRQIDGPEQAVLMICLAKALDWGNRGCRFGTGAARESISNLFSNQALNTLFSYGCRSSLGLMNHINLEFSAVDNPLSGEIVSGSAKDLQNDADIFITDPPYADAVNYHEITEFFIAWLRKNPPEPFRNWVWDSRRPLAIKGDGEDFKKGMVAAYKAMADHMPDNGLQIVMFTHQDAGVWGDMAQIFWGSGLQVLAAWYIATEANTELKKGGYVQGTVILVLRKRKDGEHGYKDEIVQEVKVEVADQIDTMSGLNQSLKGHGRIENLFEDADLQMAGYAAALRVLTKYTTIDGVDMTKEALRPRVKGEHGLVADIIEFAVQVANEHMVPEGMSPKVWENLTGSERFFFKMMDVEETGAKKLDNYQNFSRAFRVPKYDDLMGSLEPNKARLKSASEFKKSGFEGSEFGGSKSRALLFAIYEVQNDIDGDDVLSHLRDMVPDYFNVRDDLAALADYVAKKRVKIDEQESRSAGILHGLIRNERFG